MKNFLILLLLSLLALPCLKAQSGGNQSIPQLSSKMRVAMSNAGEGLLVFDTNTKSFWYYQSGWINLAKVDLPEPEVSQQNAAMTTERVIVEIQGQEKMIVDSAHLSMLFPDSSTIIGFEAGKMNAVITDESVDDQGKFNTFLGLQSGFRNDPDPNFCGEYEFNNIYSSGCGSHNTFLGDRTGFSNTVGRNNLFAGSRAGYSNLGDGFFSEGEGGTGSENTFLGFMSGHSNQQGYWNTFVGAYSGEMNGLNSMNEDIGTKNTYLGAGAARFNETGFNNVYVGSEAGGHFENNAGDENVVIGRRAGYHNKGSQNVVVGTASLANYEGLSINNRNTLIGYHAGEFLDGNGNVFIGADAGQFVDGDNQLIIGNGPSNVLIEGHFTNGHIGLNGTTLVTSEVDANLNSQSPFEVGTAAGLRIAIDGEEILAKNGTSPATLTIQKESGKVQIGTSGDATSDKLQIDVATGHEPLRARVGGITKLRVNSNGGTSVGTLTAPPVNGLRVGGDVVMTGSQIQATSSLTVSSSQVFKIIVGPHTVSIDPLGGIEITSNGDLDLKAGNNINLTANNDIIMHADSDVLINADARIDLAATTELELNSSNFIDVNANTNLLMNAGQRLDLVGLTELELNSNVLIDVNSFGTMQMNSSGIFDIVGPIVRLNASGGGGLGAARVGGTVSNPPCIAGCTGSILPVGASGSVLIGN